MKTRASKGKSPIVASDEGPHSVSSGNTAENTLRSEKAVAPSFEKTSASSEHDTTVAKSFSMQPFVPLWDVCNGDLYDNPRVCRDVATALPTPAQKSAVAQLSNTALTDELLTGWVQLGSFAVVSVEALREEMRVKEAQLCDLKKELEKEAEMLAKNRAMFEKEQAMFKLEETKMKTSLEQLSQENQLLSARVEELSQDREWLIVQGFKHVVELLHRSPEYLEPLAAIQKASHAYGMYSGIRAGYKYAAAGRAMDTVAYFAPDSKAKLHRSVHAFEEMQFPFLDLVSKDGAVPLSTLKSLVPHNAETVIAIGGQLSSSQLSVMTSPSSMLPPHFPQSTSHSLDVTPAVPESPASVMKETAEHAEKAVSK
ncbi:hypothetical protein E3N88_15148 [Mikania micrantha]|uniref:Uncharacterized protein n=1 Tax=Mikania micrantha TaxID=192012 RepID=A0A5N6NW24_9ASTR|nr:hypothetical protein E3N88_15148 [Mikania micrantha]